MFKKTKNKFQRISYFFLSLLLCILIVSLPVLALPVAPKFSIERESNLIKSNFKVSNEIIQLNQIKFNSKIDKSLLDSITNNQKKGIAEVDVIIEFNSKSLTDYRVRNVDSLENNLFSGTVNIADINNFARNRNVVRVYPNVEYTGLLDAAIPAVNAPSLWDQGINGTGMRIAILDSGIDNDHPMFEGRIILENYYIEDSAHDNNGHGTAIAGIAAGKQHDVTGYGYDGVAPGAYIINAKIMDSSLSTSTSKIYKAINWVRNPDNDVNTDDSADVISLSLGAPTSNNDPVLRNVLNKAINDGIPVVVAVGNCGPGGSSSSFCGGYEGVTLPGHFEEVISVGATDDSMVWHSSSSGDDFGTYIKPDISAPGKNVNSASNTGGLASKTGTSFSTPFVAGAIALILEQDSTLNHYDVKEILENNSLDLGAPGKDVQYGSGFLDLSQLLLESEPVCSVDLDCGIDYFENQLFCDDLDSENVYDTFFSFECVNPGTAQAECIESGDVQVIETCDSDFHCGEGECVLNDGCEFNNPSCLWFESCADNSCVLFGDGCYADNNCAADNECVDNQCTLKTGCDFSNPGCDEGNQCFNNQCYLIGEEICGDGLDNDYDGYYDCHDYDCSPAMGEPYLAGNFCTLDVGKPTCCLDHGADTGVFVESFQLDLCQGMGRYPVLTEEVCVFMVNKYSYEYQGALI